MNDPNEALDSLQVLVTSNEWFEYVKILRARREFIQGEVNNYVRHNDIFHAYGEICKLDDIEKTFQMVKNKLDTLRKEGK